MNKDYVIHNGELYHYGVPGMRWGHRKSLDGHAENRHTRRLAKAQKTIAEASIKLDKKSYLHEDGTVDAMSMLDDTIKFNKKFARAQKLKDRIIKKYNYDSGFANSYSDIKNGKAIVTATLADKNGKLYNTTIEGTFKPGNVKEIKKKK